MVYKSSTRYSITHACSFNQCAALKEELQIAFNVLVEHEVISHLVSSHWDHFTIAQWVGKVPRSIWHIEVFNVMFKYLILHEAKFGSGHGTFDDRFVGILPKEGVVAD